jgi:hypothetical protein
MAFTSSMLPFLTPGIVPSPTGAGGAVPAGAAGVTVGGGRGPVDSGMGAVLSIVVDLSLGAADGSVCPGALAAGAAGVDWLVEAGAVAGVCVGPDDWATVNIGANSKPTTARIVIPVFFAESSRISHLYRSETGDGTHLTPLAL